MKTRPRQYHPDRPSTPAERQRARRERASARIAVTILRLKRGIWCYELGDEPGEDRFHKWFEWWLYRPGGKPEGRAWGPLRFPPIYYQLTGMTPGEEPVRSLTDYGMLLFSFGDGKRAHNRKRRALPDDCFAVWPEYSKDDTVVLPSTEPEDEPLFALPPAFLNLTARITSPAVGQNGMSRTGEVSRPRTNWCPGCRGYRHQNHIHAVEPEVIRIELKVPVKVDSLKSTG